jgi:hypothetical protein
MTSKSCNSSGNRCTLNSHIYINSNPFIHVINIHSLT